VIERTEEMVQVAQAVTCGAEADECIAAAIDAALAIVERDYGITCASTCDGARCTKNPGHDGGHLGLSPNAGRVW
jgi:hypothetical protein